MYHRYVIILRMNCWVHHDLEQKFMFSHISSDHLHVTSHQTMLQVSPVALLYVLSQLVVSSGEPFPLSTVLGVVQSVQARFQAGCVQLIYPCAPKDVELESYILHSALSVTLSKRLIPVATFHLRNFMKAFDHSELFFRHPLNVLFHSNSTTKILTKMLEDHRSSQSIWLILLPDTNCEDYFAKLYVRFNQEVLGASWQTAGKVVLTSVYQVAPQTPLKTVEFGVWTDTGGLSSVPGTLYERRPHLSGLRLRGATVHNPPIVTYRTKDGRGKLGGYFGHVWRVLEQQMNFTTDFMMPTDHSEGRARNDTSCDGMLGMLYCQQVDVALGAFSVSARRATTSQFTMPLLYTSYRIFIKRPPATLLRWNDFLEPFTPKLWKTILATQVILASLLTGLHYVGQRVGAERRWLSASEAVLMVFGAFCSQGHSEMPDSTPCRMIHVTAYVTSVVMMAAYSAALVSSLTVTRTVIPFDSLSGMLKDGRYSMGVVNRSEIYFSFLLEQIPIQTQIFQRLMLPNPDNFPTNVLEGLQRVCSHRFALMTIAETARAVMSSVNCSVVSIGYRSYSSSYSFAFKTDSPYRALVNHNLRKLRDGGILYRLRNYEWPRPERTQPDAEVSVGLPTVIPLLTMLSCAIGAAGVVLVAELSWWRRGTVPRVSLGRRPYRSQWRP